jgi:hypothetical protein
LVAVDEEPSAIGPDEGEDKGRQAAAAAEVRHEARWRHACGHCECDAPRYLVTHITWPEKAEIAGERKKALKVLPVLVGELRPG